MAHGVDTFPITQPKVSKQQWTEVETVQQINIQQAVYWQRSLVSNWTKHVKPGVLELHVHDRAHWRWSPYSDNNLSSGNALSYNSQRMTLFTSSTDTCIMFIVNKHENTNNSFLAIVHSNNIVYIMCRRNPKMRKHGQHLRNASKKLHDIMVHWGSQQSKCTVSLIFILSEWRK